jgi:hypothetical protein
MLKGISSCGWRLGDLGFEHRDRVLISQTFNEADELAEASCVSFPLRIGYFVLLWCEQAPRRVGDHAACTWDEAQHTERCGASASEPSPPRNHRTRFIDGFAGVIGVAGGISDNGCWGALGRRERFTFGSRFDVIVCASQRRRRYGISGDTRLCRFNTGDAIGQILRLSGGQSAAGE